MKLKNGASWSSAGNRVTLTRNSMSLGLHFLIKKMRALSEDHKILYFRAYFQYLGSRPKDKITEI